MTSKLLFESKKSNRKNTLVDIYNKSKQYKGLDKYYTKKEIVFFCLDKLNLKDYDLIIEPSAGNGAFYNEIKHNHKIGLDIEPENLYIMKQDFLKYKIDVCYKSVLIIGNPPFGINNILSTQFLKHSFSFENTKTIAFILPNVYNKHTKQKIIPKTWRIKNIYSLSKDSFIFENKTKHIPCSFFIFDKSKGNDLRFEPEKYQNTKDFTFGTNNDFDIFVFGASPTKISINPTENNRGYFLKSKIPVEQLVKNIKSIKWKGNSCANGGVFWLTKPEFCYEYSKAIYGRENHNEKKKMIEKSNKNIIDEINDILNNFELINLKIKWIQDNKDKILKLVLQNKITELKFYKVTSLLSAQSRSPLWEKYFSRKNNFESVSKNENKGDFKKDNKYYEYKISLNDQINFRLIQIRFWQDCNYMIQFVTFEKIYTFELTKTQMIKEINQCNANPAHGTKLANKNNKNIEYTMTIKKDSDNWKRWIEKYLK